MGDRSSSQAVNQDEVLIVEDDNLLASAIKRNLEVRGYGATIAAGADDANRLITPAFPNMVLLDIDLPDGLGWDVARRLRAVGNDACVIVISGMRPNERLVTETGCRGFLEKPFPIEALIRQVEQALHPQSDARREAELLEDAGLQPSLPDGAT